MVFQSCCNSGRRRTLAIHVLLAGLSIGRVRLVVGVHVAGSIFRHGLLSNIARRGSRILVGLISYRRKLDRSRGISRGRRAIGSLGVTTTVLRDINRCCPLSLLLSLALSLLLLLPLLPLFADLLELYIVPFVSGVYSQGRVSQTIGSCQFSLNATWLSLQVWQLNSCS